MLYPIKWPKYGYEYCIGGKTGYTDIARWTLVTFAKKDDLELVCVVMKTGGPPPYEPNEYTDTIKLLNYAIDNYVSYPIDTSVKNTDEEGRYSLFTKYNTLFDENESPLYIEEGASVVLPKGVDISKAQKSIEYYDNELTEGINTIGKIIYNYDGRVAGSANILYDTEKGKIKDLNEELTEYVNELGQEKEIEKAEAAKEEEAALNKQANDAMPIGFKIFLCICAGLILIILITMIILLRRAAKRKRYTGSYTRKYIKSNRRKYRF